MQTLSTESLALAQAGANALQAGDPGRARECFERIVNVGQADAGVFVALAMAHQALREQGRMLAALERALALDPGNLRALIMKGDHLVASSSPRAALAFYNTAIAIASQAGNLPPSVVQAVRRVQQARDRINTQIEEHLRGSLARAGYDPAASSPRFTQSLDLLSGKKERFIQQPRAYFFPELPDIQFYPRERFDWIGAVEAATDDICAELQCVLEQEEQFVPYIRSSSGGPPGEAHPLLDSRDWSAYFLWKDGAPVPEHLAHCPQTMAALERVPLARIPGRTPSILFSRLKPGAHIPAHTGYLNTRLICHLPLIVPPGCHFRVGNDRRSWEKGRLWAFDDTIEHEAWNSSSHSRVVLIFDIWRPELSEEERSLVAQLLLAIDTYEGGQAVSWSE